LARSESMTALVKNGSTQEDTHVQEVPLKQVSLAPNRIRLKVSGCGLCGSDVHAWRDEHGYDWVDPPVIMGHEIVGSVIARGSDVTEPAIGTSVVPISILGCGRCQTCRVAEGPLCPEKTVIGLSCDGGATRYVDVDSHEVISIPSGVPTEVAVLIEPLSVALHAIGRLPALRADETVGVCGPGPVGLLTAWALRQMGKNVYLLGTERDLHTRIPIAKSLGIEAYTVGELLVPQADHWIEASGSEKGLAKTLETARPGGTVVVVALYGQLPSVEINLIVRKQLTLEGSYSSVRSDYEASVGLLLKAPEELRTILTHYPLEDAINALQATSEGRVMKAVLVP
jgi:L-iditol 2-dehydrogenase